MRDGIESCSFKSFQTHASELVNYERITQRAQTLWFYRKSCANMRLLVRLGEA